MLCTKWAALEGCVTTHHTTKAIAAHLAIVFKLTASSLEAQNFPLCQFPSC